jgi:hypothetical protein
MERHNETFNDGFLQYGRMQIQRSGSAKRTGESFVADGRLAFRELSARDSDYHSCGLLNAKLDLKVKTMFPPSFRSISKSKLKVRIGNMEYDVIKADWDRYYLYFYLQEVGEVK